MDVSLSPQTTEGEPDGEDRRNRVRLAGKRLFGETSDKKPMRLVDSKVVGDGIAILTYHPVR